MINAQRPLADAIAREQSIGELLRILTANRGGSTARSPTSNRVSARRA
jgi:hypothetical protein